MRRYFNLFWILMFLIGSVIPLFHMNTAEITEQENRTLAKFPEIKKKGKLNKSYGKEFEGWLGDRFWGRDQLIKSRFQTLYKINGRVENEKAFIGDDGWMFEKSKTINVPSIEKQREKIGKDAEILKKFADKFKKKNIPIYFVVIPDRETLYQKYWERYYKPKPRLDYEKELIERLFSISNLNIIPIQNKMEKLSNEEFIFYKDDCHMVDLPRKLIIKEIFERLKKDGIINKEVELVEKYGKKENQHVANISAKLGMVGKVKHYLPVLNLFLPNLKSEKLEEKKFEVLDDNAYKGILLIPYIKSKNKNAPIHKTGIFLGPCYTESAFDVLQPSFATAVKIRPNVSEAGPEAVEFIRKKGKQELSDLKENNAVIIMILPTTNIKNIEILDFNIK